jgi:hypothetical protein
MAEDFEFEDPVPEESSNRTFIIAASALGGLLLVSIICLALYAFFLAPRQQEQAANATQTAVALTRAALVEPTEVPTSTATATLQPTNTFVPTITATLTAAISTETLTPLPVVLATDTPRPTPTALPPTGFADDLDLTGLAIMAGILLFIVIVTRLIRMRMFG